MTHDSLRTFTNAVSSSWGPLASGLVERSRRELGRLLSAPAEESWLRALLADGPDSRELYRDPNHDFLLLAHTEQVGLYRPPHDHGRGWVIYGVLRGEMEMGTYRRVHDLRGVSQLVRRETLVLRTGDVRVFLPGDIHDTLCTAGPLTLLRFTSRDLKKEEVTRYPEPGDAQSLAERSRVA
ncbi:MAG: hypothetical protein JNK04_23240 [Myxococcales bacterium]|nr:hypothetical protein [Myxococcales bacterium]